MATPEDCKRFNEIMAKVTRFDSTSIGKDNIFAATSPKSADLIGKSQEEWMEVVQRSVTVTGKRIPLYKNKPNLNFLLRRNR